MTLTTIQLFMTVALFLAGFGMLVAGVVIILSKEYQETMRVLSQQSTRLHSKIVGEVAAQAAMVGTSQMIDSITRLIQTAMGTAVFLCLLGALICGTSLWMLSLISM